MYPTKTTAVVKAATMTMAIRSVSLTPKIFPNSAASKLSVKPLKRLMRAIPRAKLAVVMMPMAASALMLRFRVVRLMSTAERKPQRLAPIKKLMDMTKLTTAPPKTAWDSPWPM